MRPGDWPLFFDQAAKSYTLHIFHDDVSIVAVAAEIIYSNNIRILKLGKGFGLILKSAHEIIIHSEGGSNHFNGDNFVEFDIQGFKYKTHSAAADILKNAIVIEDFAYYCVFHLN